MFGKPCRDSDDERTAAAVEVRDFVHAFIARAFPDADADALTTASWSLVHGLAFLHLDGKYPSNSKREVAARVRSAVLALQPTTSPAK